NGSGIYFSSVGTLSGGQMVNGASQTITVTTAPPATESYQSSFTTAATASSGLTVAITASGACAVSSGGSGSATVAMTSGTGTCTVSYNQAGQGGYLAAPTVTETTTASTIPQITPVTVTGPAKVTVGLLETATASGGTGAGGVTFSAGSSTGCSVNGNVVTLTNVNGTCSLTAT